MKNNLRPFFQRCVRWVRRFRKRCGYGIHSPFAFNLVTGVIYESWDYYAYRDLLSEGAKYDSPLRLKDQRLLFRLANHHQPGKGWVVGSGLDLPFKYLSRGCEHCAWQRLPENSPAALNGMLAEQRQLDFIYLHGGIPDEHAVSLLLSVSHDHSLYVIQGIHGSERAFDLWNQLIADDRVRVTFDLFDFGLVYFEKRLNKENYVINYF